MLYYFSHLNVFLTHTGNCIIIIIHNFFYSKILSKSPGVYYEHSFEKKNLDWRYVK